MSPITPKREPSRARRLIVLTAVYLTLGFVSCVLVTWWMALTTTSWYQLSLEQYENFRCRPVVNGEPPKLRLGVKTVLSDWTVDILDITKDPIMAQFDDDPSAVAMRMPNDGYPRGTRVREIGGYVDEIEALSEKNAQAMVYRWGWPMRCLGAEVIQRGHPLRAMQSDQPWVVIQGGYILGEKPRNRDTNKTNWYETPKYILPVRPRIGPFLFNTLAYALTIGLTVELVRFLSQFRIVRAGPRTSCSKCGYARKGLAPGSPCPECGFEPAKTKAAPNEGAAGY